MLLPPRRRAGGADQGMSYLFEAHPLVLSYMVPSLLSVYSDVEHTDRANQFYAKFNMRQYIGEAARNTSALPQQCMSAFVLAI
jgi:hypothetical protein